MSQTLSLSDVKRLLEDPSAENRSETARKVASGYKEGMLSVEERRIAEDIFSVMVRDAEVRVREALSDNLKNCAFIAHDLARTLSEDVDSVALPMLRYSEVLTDDDLIDIVRQHGPSKQKAVASRTIVSEPLSEALVDNGNEEVVETLIANEGAEIAEPALIKVVEEFAGNERISGSLAGREKLPVGVYERLVGLVSDSIREHILGKHDLAPDRVTDLILHTREKATLGLLNQKSDNADIHALVSQLFESGRLTPSIILRALCMGDLRFFEAAVALLAKVPITNARVLIHDDGGLGLGSILQKAQMPNALLPAIKAAVEVSHETDYDGGENDRERFRRRMIERILTQLEYLQSDMGEEDIDYLLTKLSQIEPGVTQAA